MHRWALPFLPAAAPFRVAPHRSAFLPAHLTDAAQSPRFSTKPLLWPENALGGFAAPWVGSASGVDRASRARSQSGGFLAPP